LRLGRLIAASCACAPALCAGLPGAAFAADQLAAAVPDLSRLSIEELANLEITSVSRAPEVLSQAPAAVFVVTNDDIRRSGAVSLAEALRLAPNLQVARFDTLSYGITARGFNSIQASNKLLVLIDGRTVYTPLASGVYWQAQAVVVEDVERIEVVSGPGGTLWGTNAVNGVINVISRSSKETQGALLSGTYGNLEKRVLGRFGGRLGDNGTFRVHALLSRRGPLDNLANTALPDEWDNRQAGFRADWDANAGTITLQGDYYDRRADIAGKWWGGNVLGRWAHRFAGGSALQLQAYYDRANRDTTGVVDQLNTYDVSLQHNLAPLGRHSIVWGGGYRITDDYFNNTLNAFNLDPKSRTLGLANLYAQDQIAVAADLHAIVGLKVEHNAFTGFEFLPNVRLAWQRPGGALLWAAVSRAVRTPSRIDRQLTAPGILIGSNFDSEKLIAYEAGYRSQPVTGLSLSVSAFWNEYDNIRSTELTNGGLPVQLLNGRKGHTYGGEAWARYAVRPWWQVSAGVSALGKDIPLKPGHNDISNAQSLGNDPDFQAQLRSQFNLSPDVDFDLAFRAVGELNNPPVPGYVEADARFAWRITPNLELSLAGFNLLHEQHVEAENRPDPVRAVPRSVQFTARVDL
jgi:iron complex outermembrane recepter protein